LPARPQNAPSSRAGQGSGGWQFPACRQQTPKLDLVLAIDGPRLGVNCLAGNTPSSPHPPATLLRQSSLKVPVAWSFGFERQDTCGVLPAPSLRHLDGNNGRRDGAARPAADGAASTRPGLGTAVAGAARTSAASGYPTESSNRLPKVRVVSNCSDLPLQFRRHLGPDANCQMPPYEKQVSARQGQTAVSGVCRRRSWSQRLVRMPFPASIVLVSSRALSALMRVLKVFSRSAASQIKTASIDTLE
jgi:hypothetical protein